MRARFLDVQSWRNRQDQGVSSTPDRQRGADSRELDAVVGSPQHEHFYYVEALARSRSSNNREMVSLPIVAPHEAFREEVRHRGDLLRSKLREAVLPRSYDQHPVVQRQKSSTHPVPVFPVALYLDSVPFAREDAVWGVWMVCLLTTKRWLLCAVRKSHACACGCRSWCTLFPVWAGISWSFAAAAAGIFPNAGWDGGALDAARASVAGQELGFALAVLLVKCDMAEYCHTLGFPGTTSAAQPCPLCFASVATAYARRGLSALKLPWLPKSLDVYLEACQNCEILIELTDELWREILAALTYTAGNGRTLAVDVPAAGLVKGDRLEPSVYTPDIGAGFSKRRPERAIFWRSSPGGHYSSPEPSLQRGYRRLPLWFIMFRLSPLAELGRIEILVGDPRVETLGPQRLEGDGLAVGSSLGNLREPYACGAFQLVSP